MNKIFNSDSIIPVDDCFVIVDKKAEIERLDIILKDGVIEKVWSKDFGYKNPLYKGIAYKIIATIGKRLEGNFSNLEDFIKQNPISANYTGHKNEWEKAIIEKWGEMMSKNKLEGVPLIELPYVPTTTELLITTAYCMGFDDGKATKGNKWDYVEQKVKTIMGTDSYKAAQSKGMYSEGDMRIAIDMARSVKENMKTGEDLGYTFTVKNILRHLQPKRRIPTSITLETMMEYEIHGGTHIVRPQTHHRPFKRILKITNPETNTIIPIEIKY